MTLKAYVDWPLKVSSTKCSASFFSSQCLSHTAFLNFFFLNARCTYTTENCINYSTYLEKYSLLSLHNFPEFHPYSSFIFYLNYHSLRNVSLVIIKVETEYLCDLKKLATVFLTGVYQKDNQSLFTYQRTLCF